MSCGECCSSREDHGSQQSSHQKHDQHDGAPLVIIPHTLALLHDLDGPHLVHEQGVDHEEDRYRGDGQAGILHARPEYFSEFTNIRVAAGLELFYTSRLGAPDPSGILPKDSQSYNHCASD